MRDTGFGMPTEEQRLILDQELESIMEGEFDEAAVPMYQCIKTFARKKLKMKKHRRQKRRDKMRIKLKWSGKL